MKAKKKKREWKSEKIPSENSTNDGENNDELDLTDYAGNSIKLMTEIFKILGDKKLKQMVPSILNPIDINDLKACLVEESMALSKKRVISILNGEVYATSSESEEETHPKEGKKPDFDVISLDGISDDSDIFCFDDLPEAEVLPEVKKEPKKEKKKHKKAHKTEKALTIAEEKAMTALELLELQARARAIKSQLALESVTSPMDNIDEEIKNEPTVDTPPIKNPTKKVKLRRNHLRIDPRRTVNKNEGKNQPANGSQENDDKQPEIKKERRSSTDSLIVESPSHPLIVLTSSDDDEEKKIKKDQTEFTDAEKSLINLQQSKENSTKINEEPTENEIRKRKISENEKLNENNFQSPENENIEKKIENVEDCIVIDSEPDFDSEPEHNEGNDATWKKRWLDSKKVKSVLQTSKLCNSVKRKLKKDSSIEGDVIEEQVEDVGASIEPEVEGSIAHFNMLSKNSPQA